ncbi:putative integral inner membrane protein [Streptomyces bingchenggensis BCW-1]|uniref:Putative integral inner membrane protein n=1 Tax=Streptomyces bingchenggensis (strain BCW-1) TaxID=749414 RepID=D7C7I5_STRBB|nr:MULTISPECIES: YrdB family protein [Streptomyces]ADI12533.1 putative integral inner membrane protein [Streptomyces bingchenggensis BCW-1]
MNVTLALANNDAMLAVRFLLELVSLACVTLWAWRRVPSPWRWAAVVLLPVAVGWSWGTFTVPDDPSRSGESDIHTPGPVRLLLELAVFFGAVAALHFAGLRRAARWLLAVMVAYQILAYDRVGWLLSH